MAGYFITFEGIDGAGKSTHIGAIAQDITNQGLEVVLTREPGGTPLAEKVRTMILSDDMDIMTETLLAYASRRDHIMKVIRPALAQGKVVLCDRYTDSTIAYQGYGREGDLNLIRLLEKFVQSSEISQDILQPDLTLWFDLDPAIAARRLSGAREPDRFESQSAAFFERVRSGYVSRMREDPKRFIRIEADQKQEEVFVEVMAIFKERFRGPFSVWSGSNCSFRAPRLSSARLWAQSEQIQGREAVIKDKNSEYVAEDYFREVQLYRRETQST